MTVGAVDLARTELNLHLIGASDVPSIVGVSGLPGRTGLYNRIKYGLEAERSPWLNRAGRLGQLYEVPTAVFACESLGIDPGLLEKADSIQHPGGLEWARYSLDPFVRSEPVLFEVKCRAGYNLRRQGWGEDGSAEVPPSVWVQVQSQLAFLERDRDRWLGCQLPEVERVHVLCAVDGQDVQIHPVPRDRAAGAALLELAERFWVDHVVGTAPIPADGTEAGDAAVAALFPLDSGAIRLADAAELDLVKRAVEADARLAEAEELARTYSQNLKLAIGDDAGIEGGGYRVTWRSQRGRVKHDAVAAELARRIDLPSAELEALEEKHRGKAFRSLRITEI